MRKLFLIFVASMLGLGLGAAQFVGSVMATNSTGRLVAPTNFFFGNLWAGSNIYLEKTNRTGYIIHGSAAGAAGGPFQPASTILTNLSGTGALTNASDFQPASEALTNWSQYTTNIWNSRQGGSLILTNLEGTGALTNASDFQASSMVLSNIVGTGALTNAADFQPASANLTNWSNIPTGTMANVVSTTFLTNWANAVSNYVTAATNSASVTNWITQRQPASTILTNLSGTGALTNATDFQPADATLTNLAGNSYKGYTNQVFGGTNISVRTAGGTNFVDTTGQLNNWAIYSTNVWNSRQGGSAILTNLAGTGAITNYADLVWTNAAGDLYPVVDQPRITFATNRIFGRLIRADGTNTAFGSNALPDLGGFYNTAIGQDALSLGGGTEANTAIGHHSSYSNSSGSFNTSVGKGALEQNQYRSDNTAVGYQALQGFVTGFENTAIGSSTMDALTDSYYGTALGWGALDKLQGLGNTALGHSAMLNAQGGGSYNLAVGFESMHNADRPDSVVAIGRGTFDGVDDITNMVAVGNGATAISGFLTNSVALGANSRITANNQIMFGTNVTQYVFRNLIYAFPSAYGSDGFVLTNDGAGNLGWNVDKTSAGASGLSTNANQFLGVPLAIKNGAFLTNLLVYQALNLPHLAVSQNAVINAQGDLTNSAADFNWSLYPTNVWNDRQGGSAILTNLAGTGAITNYADLVWTNNTVSLNPISFPTNILLRVDVPDDGVGTNFYWDARTYRANAASKLFNIYNGGSNALTVGPFGGVFIGRNNATPVNLYAFNAIRDTTIGEPNSAFIQTKAAQSTVGYFGTCLFGVNTNSSELTMRTFDGVNKQCIFAVTADNFTNSTLKLTDKIGSGERGVFLSPGIGLTYPTNYMFNTWYELTNTDTLLSLQNSNTPVFEVDGIGDLKLLKRVAYSWPSAQGGASTVLANDGSGGLSWSGSFQPGNTRLTNLTAISYTGYTNQVFGGSNTSVRTSGGTNFVDTIGELNNWVNFSTNTWNSRQGGSSVLTNYITTEEFNGKTVFTNLDFTGARIKTMTNAITGSRTNNLTNAVGGASMIVYVVGDTAAAADYNYTFTAAAANIRWMNSPTNANAIDVLIHSNQVYAFWFDVTTNATGPATNIIARWATTSQRPILNKAIPISAGAGTSNAWMGGTVFLDAVTATTNLQATAVYTNLFTFTVPGNTLTNVGDELEFYLSGNFKFGTANTNGFKCIYGTSTVFDTGFLTISNCPWKAIITITGTGGSAQRVEAEVIAQSPAAGSFGNAALTAYRTNMPLAQVNGTTNIFAFQGTSRVVAAITNDYRRIRWSPGPR